jgi:hypothetical protein
MGRTIAALLFLAGGIVQGCDVVTTTTLNSCPSASAGSSATGTLATVSAGTGASPAGSTGTGTPATGTTLLPAACGDGIPYGLEYSLPKGQVRLDAARKPVPPDDLIAAENAAAPVGVQIGADVTALGAAQKKLADDQSAPGTSSSTLAADQALVDGLTTKIAAEKEQLAILQSKVNIIKQQEKGGWAETATITILPPYPDPNYHFVANLAHNQIRDDSIKLGVSNGLLSSANATEVGQAPAVLQAIADTILTAGTLPGLVGTLPSMLLTGQATKAAEALIPQCKPYQYSKIFDPSDPDDIGVVEHDYNDNTDLHPMLLLDVHSRNDELKGVTKSLPFKSETSGLIYRVPMSVTLTLQPRKVDSSDACFPQSTPAVSSQIAVVPDSKTAFILPMHAGPFTSTNLTFNFVNGMPTEFDVSDPSEIVAVLNVPIKIAQDIISIPTSLIQLRVNQDTATNQLLTLLNTQIQARATLRTTIQNQGSPQSTTNTTSH